MICNNYDKIKQEIGDVTLLVVSKTQPNEKIRALYNHGVREFGENRINDLKLKRLALPDDIIWHFVGRIQTKKIRDIVKNASLIHSVDSVKTLEVINHEAQKINKVQKVLVQVNVSEEASKTGFYTEELEDVIKLAKKFKHVSIEGLMTMAPFIDDEAELRRIFSEMQTLANSLELKELSMGMSNDYKIAIECGATIVRIGTSIFKEEE